jgi:class 3 adenylate cyclase/tetratricopeptide (TPR) repeat protein
LFRSGAVSACPACRAPLPDGARFCPACGTRLGSDGPEATERKVVTTLFADLVGFTALGERHDPEDADAALRAYYTLARMIIERFGGSVEKFIGDAVVGIFGVPVAHADDAERAVRAALEVVAHLHELPRIGEEKLQVRCAANTGPALVRLRARPEAGEGVLVGDAVNTSARLLEDAPPMGVVVGEATRQLSSRAIVYQAMSPILARGKTGPVQRWLARGTIAHRGADVARREDPPMIGREVELAVISGLLDRALASRRPQFALVQGDPGIGKSRLLREFFRRVDTREGFLCSWRQGYCPPFGDELTYWAVREIVAAQAGILPQDPAHIIEQKLQAAIDDPQSDWILRALRPLMGVSSDPVQPEHSYAAWCRFLETIGRDRPAVIVIEDLHWASAPTLDFLSYMCRHAEDAMVLLIATARPELLAAHPSLMEQASGIVHIPVRALDDQESERLAASLPGVGGPPDLLERVSRLCGGNPLFAEELAHYLRERTPGDELSTAVRGGSTQELPTSILALIAARVDTLPSDQKSVIADASVVGHVFSADALHELRDDDMPAIEAALQDLEKRDFIRSAPDAPADRPAYTFWHALVRDVTYSSMPRLVRAAKHRAVAEWMAASEVAAGTSELSEVVAHHYATAVSLANAAGDAELLDRLRVPARQAHGRAGNYSFALDVAGAEKHFRAALELCDRTEEDYAVLLSDHARSLAHLGRIPAAVDEWREATDKLLDAGDLETAVESMVQLARFLYLLGDTGFADVAEEAVRLAEQGPRGPGWLAAKAYWCFVSAASYEGESAVLAADEALQACAELGQDPSPVLRGHRGMARCDLGDEGGLKDLKLAIDETRRRALPFESSVLSYDYADALHLWEGPHAALQVVDAALEYDATRGDKTSAAFLHADRLLYLAYAGHWDDVLERADDLMAELKSHGQAGDLVQIAVLAAYLRSMRLEPVDPAEIETLCESALPAGPDERITYWSYLARVYGFSGERDTAVALLARAADARDALHVPLQTGMTVSIAADAAWAVNETDLAERFARGVPDLRTIDRNISLSHRARLLGRDRPEEAASSHGAAAAAWRAFGTPLEEAQALVAQGRCLLATGPASAAAAPLEAAVAILTRLRAEALLPEVFRLSRTARGSPD